jgi:hypothetical protein
VLGFDHPSSVDLGGSAVLVVVLVVASSVSTKLLQILQMLPISLAQWRNSRLES